MKSNDSFHPSVSLIYFAFILIISMFSGTPFLQISAFAGGILTLSQYENLRKFIGDFLFYIFLSALIAVSNPLFSHRGVTPLFFINGKAFTLEALAYGANLGITVCGVIIWFRIFSYVMDREKFLYLFAGFSPKTALVITMIMGYIPKIKRQYKTLMNAQKGIGLYSSGSKVEKLRFQSGIFTALCGWLMESSVESSMSMQARGYGIKRRTYMNNCIFRKSDLAALIYVIFLAGVTLAYLGMKKTDFQFYPEIKIKNTGTVSIMTFSCLCLLPFFIKVKERIEWKLYRAKI